MIVPTKSLNLGQAVGSLLVVGLSGSELTSLERAWLRLLRPAGVILFRRNIKDAEQTRALLDEGTGLCARNSVRYVDVEGGTVNRLRDALAPLPSAQAVGTAAGQNRPWPGNSGESPRPPCRPSASIPDPARSWTSR